MDSFKITEKEVNQNDVKLIEEKIKKYPDFPRPGVLFYDIFSILNDYKLAELLFKNSILAIQTNLKERNLEVNCIASLESRGFLLGPLIAQYFKASFIPIRKQNKKNSKLPGKLISIEYGTEYSKDAFDLQADAVNKDSKVLLVDDLLATGGSLKASEDLINLAGATCIGAFCPFELGFLKGREKLQDPKGVSSLIYLKE